MVRCCRERNRITYRVPMEVIEAFKNNVKYTPKDISGISCHELFAEIENIFSMRNDDELTYEATVEKIQHLFDCNKHLIYVQKVRSHRLFEEDEMMLILFSHLFVNNNDDGIRYHDLGFLYHCTFEKSRLKRED